MTDQPHLSTSGLPDPAYDAAFYRDIPAKRLLAFLIDTVIILALTVVLIPFTGFTALFYLPFLGWLVSIAYRIITISRSSATIGMRIAAIEFRDHRGRKFDTGTAVMHTLIFVAMVSFVLPQVVSIILIMTGARAQSLGDHLLGTAAINRAAL